MTDVPLRDLEPRFLKVDEDLIFHNVDRIEEADGVIFLCPKCFVANNGKIGTHSVICWSPKVPQTIHPVPGRWNLTGTGLDDLTLVAGSSSVQLTSGCMWHGFITKGVATNA